MFGRTENAYVHKTLFRLRQNISVGGAKLQVRMTMLNYKTEVKVAKFGMIFIILFLIHLEHENTYPGLVSIDLRLTLKSKSASVHCNNFIMDFRQAQTTLSQRESHE